MTPRETSDSTRISWRLYLVVSVGLLAIPFGGYGIICGRDAYRRRAEDCFRKPVREFVGHAEPVSSIAFLPDGRRFDTGSEDGTIRLWDLRTGKELLRLQRPAEVVLREVADKNLSPEWERVFLANWNDFLCVAVSPDGRYVLSGGWDTVMRLWDLESGKEARSFEGHTVRIHDVAFSPDGRRAASVSTDGFCRYWDIESGRSLGAVKGFPQSGSIALMSVAFSRDGSCIYVGDVSGKVYRIDPAKGRSEMLRERWQSSANSLRLSSDGKRLLCGGKYNDRRFFGEACIIDVESGKAQQTFRLPARDDVTESFISSADFSPDERLVLTGGWAQTRTRSGTDEYNAVMGLWKSESGELVRPYEFPSRSGATERAVRAVAFSPDGHYILSAGWRGSVEKREAELLLWRLPDRLGYWLLGTQKAEATPAPRP